MRRLVWMEVEVRLCGDSGMRRWPKRHELTSIPSSWNPENLWMFRALHANPSKTPPDPAPIALPDHAEI